MPSLESPRPPVITTSNCPICGTLMIDGGAHDATTHLYFCPECIAILMDITGREPDWQSLPEVQP